MSIAALVLVHVLFGPPPSADEVARAVREVYADDGVQRDLPVPQRWGRDGFAPQRDRTQTRPTPAGTPLSDPGGGSAGGSGRGGDGTGRADRSGRSGRSGSSNSSGPPGAPGSGAAVLLWALVGLGAAVLVAAVLRAFAERTAKKKPFAKLAPVEATASAPLPPPPLDEVDRLAGEGRYDDATHLLLLRAVRTIVVDGRQVPSHWTSREVLSGAGIGASRESALAVVVEAVERSLFGGQPIDAKGFQASREAYDRFAAPTAPASASVA